MKIVLELTQEQAVALRNLLDLSVKAGGLQAAELALPIDAMIREAAQVAASPPPGPSGDVIRLGSGA